ncbi:MAG: L-histidine N(alpha)-methyltransferase [Dehalococcoidia bacterium]
MADFTLDNHLNGSGFFDSMAADVAEGLQNSPMRLRPKYLYDERGSDLFEQITELIEYYPMRAEGELLNAIADDVIAAVRPDEILELGSGSSTKTRLLLDAGVANGCLKRYLPFDVSESIIRLAAGELQQRYPDLELHGVVGDFEADLGKAPPPDGKRLVLFLGSTIGNLHAEERVAQLSKIREVLGENGSLLLGTDLVKEVATIEAAYNDAAGVTAEFNRNMLNVLNAGLEGDFDPAAFDHYAYFNRDDSRIEMHLRPRSPQVAHLRKLDLTIEISPEETIWTESSYKFTRESVAQMLREAGLKLDRWYAAPGDLFGLSLSSRA